MDKSINQITIAIVEDARQSYGASWVKEDRVDLSRMQMLIGRGNDTMRIIEAAARTGNEDQCLGHSWLHLKCIHNDFLTLRVLCFLLHSCTPPINVAIKQGSWKPDRNSPRSISPESSWSSSDTIAFHTTESSKLSYMIKCWHINNLDYYFHAR